MTISAILEQYTDASPDLIERLTLLIRRELEADEVSRRCERAIRAARMAQAQRLDALMADAASEAAPEPQRAKPKPKAPDPAKQKAWVTRRAKALAKADAVMLAHLNRSGRIAPAEWAKVETMIRQALDPSATGPERETFRRKAVELIEKRLPSDIPDEFKTWVKASKTFLEKGVGR